LYDLIIFAQQLVDFVDNSASNTYLIANEMCGVMICTLGEN
jgi:hypothetical protein